MECTPNRESLLALIQPGMKLTKEFIKRIYAFNMDYPGFSEETIMALEGIGCVRAREHYMAWVQEYEAKHDAELKEAAHWYQLECEKQWEKKQKEGVEKRKQNEMNLLMKRKKLLLRKKLQILTDN